MRIWEIFPDVAEAVRKKHEEAGLFGHHDWAHAFRVGEVARQIVLGEWQDERLSRFAGLAGLAHNADHIIHKKKGGAKDMYDDNVSEKAVRSLVAYWLSSVELAPPELETIVDAVLNHAAKNIPEDSDVLVALKDADRVVNLDADFTIRAGQYHNGVPAVDCQHFLSNPDATFRSPKSVLRHINFLFEWVDSSTPFCIRTKIGKEMAGTRASFLREFVILVKLQLTNEGLYPYPF